MVYTYIVSLPSVAQDNKTLIAKKVIRVLDCSSNLPINESCYSWNYNHCPGDNDYCNPFIVGDKIYQQFFGPQGKYTVILVQVYNAATNEEIVGDYPFLTIENGVDANLVGFKNIIIDTDKFDDIDCFYTRIKAYVCNSLQNPVILEEFEACVADLIASGKTQTQAYEICLDGLCEDATIDIAYSEPYCKIECEQDSILIEGYYPKYDCNGNFYGEFSSTQKTNSYKTQIRILGEVGPVDNNIEVTFINTTKRKTAQNFVTHNIRGHEKMPYYVIQKIANIFASQKVYVDGVEYLNGIKISKNNEQGKMWILDENITTTCGEVDFSCD
jgi:hypothetical protein